MPRRGRSYSLTGTLSVGERAGRGTYRRTERVGERQGRRMVPRVRKLKVR